MIWMGLDTWIRQERPADRHLLGVIVLEGCEVQRSDSDGELAFSLVFGPGLKTYTFAAGDHPTQESWVKALFSASHCYVSLLLRDLARQYEEAKQHVGCGEPGCSAGALSLSTSSLSFTAQAPSALVREGRSFSASSVLQAPSKPAKVVVRKSPKLWSRRNAYVTPLNGPAPSYGEWPLVGSDPLEEFSKLHDYYGQEVKKAREEWLRSRRTPEDGDLIDLG